MKTYRYNHKYFFVRFASVFIGLIMMSGIVLAQDSTQVTEQVPEASAKLKPVKNTFESIWLGDNQTVMVPIKGTFEIDIMHRFGTVKNGYKDFFGFFSPSNIRLGFSYTPIDKLLIGTSITKYNMTAELFGKYAIKKQMRDNSFPVSITYYGDAAIETKSKDNYQHFTDRLSFFHQFIIARKISDKISLQVSPSYSHINIVNGYYKDSATLARLLKHDHFAISVCGRYKLKEAMALFFNYDQPLTKHVVGNPNPNLLLGLELTTSSHAFQFFVGNFYNIVPQQNNFFNHNNYEKGEFLIGFNITRMWNY